ncbi:MAG: OmpH family outer membrane protein [Flavobacterium sp.]
MKKWFVLLCIFGVNFWVSSQTRGIRIGYIDMEYILQNVPEYTEAKNQLELKAQKWRQEIDVKKNEIKALKEALKNERVLLTKELLEEREEEIAFLQNELNDYQNKRFGPTGDLVTQKSVLVKPIQDQVFSAVQDIAEAQKFDFVLDKSSDLTLLFANKRYDISDRVIRSITRSSKREQLSKKQLKELEDKEREEDFIDDNPALAERKRVLEERKTERERMMEERKQLAEQRKAEFEARRQKMIEEREAKKTGTVSAKDSENDSKKESQKGSDGESESRPANDEKTSEATAARAKVQEDRNKTIEDRKREIEERKQKILAEREAAKKAREEQKNENKDK